jgi:microcompartment protein CcmL/EutN
MEHAERLGLSTPPEAFDPTIGLLEFSSIAKGIEATDAVMKEAPVRVLWARTVSPGRFVLLFTGTVEAAKSAYLRGLELGVDAIVDDLLIPNIHPSVLDAVRGPRRGLALDAVGIIETHTVAAAIVAADVAPKRGTVELIEVRLAMHLGGKGVVTLTGEVSDVEEAIAAGAEQARARGALLRDVVIPRAAAGLAEFLF